MAKSFGEAAPDEADDNESEHGGQGGEASQQDVSTGLGEDPDGEAKEREEGEEDEHLLLFKAEGGLLREPHATRVG